MADFWVIGIVAVRDKNPYIQLSNEKGIIAQLSMSETRQIAMDMLVMASRTEADALLWRFVKSKNLPEQMGAELMQMFRDFRTELDDDKEERPEG